MRKILLLFIAIALFLPACQKKGNHISEIEPPFGNISGSDDVIISGNGFKPGMTVHFGSHQATRLVIDSPTRIRVKSPSGSEGKVDVIITLEDGTSFGMTKGFEYRRDG